MTSPLHFVKTEVTIKDFESMSDMMNWIAHYTTDNAYRKRLMDEAVSNRRAFGKYFIKLHAA